MARSSSSSTPSKLAVAGTVLVVVVVAAAIGWWRWETVSAWLGIGDEAQSAGDEIGVNLTEVSDHPEPLYGHEVTISGDVHDVLGDEALLLGDSDPFVGDVVLVVAPGGLDVDLDGPLRVTGEVRRFDPAAGEVAEVSLPPSTGYDGAAVVVASAIVPAEDGPHPGDTEQRGPSAGSEREVDIDEVLDDTDDLVGEEVTVSGEVERVLSPTAMRIGDAMLLVVGPRDEEPFVEATAVVTGTVVRYDEAAVERLLGVDVAPGVGTPGEPAIVVSSVDVLA